MRTGLPRNRRFENPRAPSSKAHAQQEQRLRSRSKTVRLFGVGERDTEVISRSSLDTGSKLSSKCADDHSTKPHPPAFSMQEQKGGERNLRKKRAESHRSVIGGDSLNPLRVESRGRKNAAVSARARGPMQNLRPHPSPSHDKRSKISLQTVDTPLHGRERTAGSQGNALDADRSTKRTTNGRQRPQSAPGMRPTDVPMTFDKPQKGSDRITLSQRSIDRVPTTIPEPRPASKSREPKQ